MVPGTDSGYLERVIKTAVGAWHHTKGVFHASVSYGPAGTEFRYGS